MKKPPSRSLRVRADQLFMDLKCDSCQGAFSLTVGNVRQADSIGCPRCRATVALKTQSVVEEVARVERQLWISHHADFAAKRRLTRRALSERHHGNAER